MRSIHPVLGREAAALDPWVDLLDGGRPSRHPARQRVTTTAPATPPWPGHITTLGC